MLLEKYEDFLELSVKQFAIQLSSQLNFPKSDNMWCVKDQTLI